MIDFSKKQTNKKSVFRKHDIQILWRIGGIPEHIHTLPGLRSSYWFHSVSPVKKKPKTGLLNGAGRGSIPPSAGHDDLIEKLCTRGGAGLFLQIALDKNLQLQQLVFEWCVGLRKPKCFLSSWQHTTHTGADCSHGRIPGNENKSRGESRRERALLRLSWSISSIFMVIRQSPFSLSLPLFLPFAQPSAMAPDVVT